MIHWRQRQNSHLVQNYGMDFDGRMTEDIQGTTTGDTWYGSHEDTRRNDTEDVVSESGVTQGMVTEDTQGTMTDDTWNGSHEDTHRSNKEDESESGVTQGRVTEYTHRSVSESIYGRDTQVITETETETETACQDVSEVNHSFRLSPLDTSQQCF